MNHTVKLWKILVILVAIWIVSLGYRIFLDSIRDKIINEIKQEIIDQVYSESQDYIDRRVNELKRDLEYKIGEHNGNN